MYARLEAMGSRSQCLCRLHGDTWNLGGPQIQGLQPGPAVAHEWQLSVVGLDFGATSPTCFRTPWRATSCCRAQLTGYIICAESQSGGATGG